MKESEDKETKMLELLLSELSHYSSDEKKTKITIYLHSRNSYKNS